MVKRSGHSVNGNHRMEIRTRGLGIATISQALQWGRKQLEQAEVCGAQQEVLWLLAHALGLSSAQMLSRSHQELPETKVRNYKKMIFQRRAHHPLQYILGEEYFLNFSVRVGPGVLIPRPETELIIHVVQQRYLRASPQWIVDLGTGSGVLALALARLFPQSRVMGTDISSRALAYARVNRRRLHVKNVQFLQGSGTDRLPKSLRGNVDLVVTNPPYIPSQQLGHLQPEVQREPRRALDGGTLGYSGFRIMIPSAVRVLRYGGMFITEVGMGQAGVVQKLLTQAGFTQLEVKPDDQDIPRIVSGIYAPDSLRKKVIVKPNRKDV
jgi:release factor glutamine methyltransferase